jgi:hypothetical protein
MTFSLDDRALLWQAIYERLREDKPAAEVRREVPIDKPDGAVWSLRVFFIVSSSLVYLRTGREDCRRAVRYLTSAASSG